MAFTLTELPGEIVIQADNFFSLSFIDGHIRKVFNLKADPEKTSNLSDSAFTRVEFYARQQYQIEVGFPVYAELLTTTDGMNLQQKILEDSAIRKVVQCTGNLAHVDESDGIEYLDSGWAFRTIYVIYPDGRILIKFESVNDFGQDSISLDENQTRYTYLTAQLNMDDRFDYRYVYAADNGSFEVASHRLCNGIVPKGTNPDLQMVFMIHYFYGSETFAPGWICNSGGAGVSQLGFYNGGKDFSWLNGETKQVYYMIELGLMDNWMAGFDYQNFDLAGLYAAYDQYISKYRLGIDRTSLEFELESRKNEATL